MVQIKCDVKNSMPLGYFEPFQGDLKKRTPKDIEQLANSILTDGLLAPFYVWEHDGHNYLLDGHGRLAALTEIALRDKDVATQPFPYVSITADTEDEARKSLLAIVSSFGKVTKSGVMKFVAPMNIKPAEVPVFQKYNKPVVQKVQKEVTHKIIRIQVPIDKEAEVVEILSSVSYIKVV